MTMEEAAEAAVAAATEESSAAEGRRLAGADVAALGPDQLTGWESAAQGAPLGRTGCWAQPGQLAGASEVAASAAVVSEASVAAAEASVAFVAVVEVVEQEPPQPEGALLRCAKVR